MAKPALTRSRSARCIAFALSACLGGGVAAQTSDPGKWAPYIDVEGKFGSKRSLGETNLFLPVMQDANTLYFANLRVRVDDEGDREGSIGGGVRRMLDSGWNVGAYGFLDRRKTDLDTYFSQATLGVEALGRDFDLRANIYRPVGTRARGLGTVNAAEFTGGGLMISTISNEQRALPGLDLEVGWRVPVFNADDSRQLRTYLAGYRFSDAGFRLEGARVRAEFTLAEFDGAWKGTQLTLGAEYQHDSARGSQSFAGVRLRVPLGARASSPARTLNAQERRMTAPVVRDVDIVTQKRDREISREAAVATASGAALAAYSDADTSGADLPAAVASAGANSTVALKGSFMMTSPLQLQPGQTVIGAGSLGVRTASGRIVTVVLPGATVDRTAQSLAGTSATVVMADDSTLIGMNVNQLNYADSYAVNRRGVNVIGVSNVTITNNVIQVQQDATSSSATALGIENSSNVTVIGNTLIGRSIHSNTAALVVLDSSILVQGNSFSAISSVPDHSFGVLLADTTGSSLTIAPGSNNNVLRDGACDIPIAMPVGSVGLTNGATCP